MNIQTYHLIICDDTRTKELFYSGNENITIKCNVPDSEEDGTILFPRAVLEKFMELICNA